MTDKQLPPLPTPKFTETIRGVPCITVTEHEHLMHAYALQALAQVQGEAATVAVDHFDNAPNTEFTNRIYPPVEIGTKLYTAPQAVQATQADVTDEQILSLDCVSIDSDEHGTSFWVDRSTVIKFARAILALRPAAVPMTDEHLLVLKEMADRCPELNLSNYDSDDVDGLNSWAVEIAVYIDGITAQAKKEGV